MADSLRNDGTRAADHAAHVDREARIEQLLLAGLDSYLAERYEQAINVWTRVLFFDRSHPRARAYIERARSAMAERQRQAEELLERGRAAIDRGAYEEARRLLHGAAAAGASQHEVRVLLDRLGRSGRGAPATRPVPPSASAEGSAGGRALPLEASLRAGAEPARRRRVRLTRWTALFALAVVVAAAGAVVAWGRADLRARAADRKAQPAAAASPLEEAAVPVPRRAARALRLARVHAANGRLREALAELETVKPTDPEIVEADRLRADLQRALLGDGELRR